MSREQQVLEVELKFPVTDPLALRQKLAKLGWRQRSVETQVDEYFAHPCRDFVRTDEAFRIRTVNGETCLTYKGPRLDEQTKTREEVEVWLDAIDENPLRMTRMLAALGFESREFVRKQRGVGEVEWQGRQVTVSLDSVDELGEFVEIEVLAGPQELDIARQAVLDLAAELDLHESERRGYLTLLQEKRGSSAG